MKKSGNTFCIKYQKQEQRKTRKSENLFSLEYLWSSLAVKQWR